MSGNTIRRRLHLLTLVLPLTMLLIIIGYFAYQDSKLLYGSLYERGDNISRYLASAAEYAVITGNVEQMAYIGEAVLKKDIVAFKVYDVDERLIYIQGEITTVNDIRVEDGAIGKCGVNGEYVTFCAPVFLAPVAFSDYENGTDSNEMTTIGRVELTLTTRRIEQKRTEIVTGSLLLALLVAIIALWLTRRMERQIVRPLRNISDTVEQVRKGNLGAKVNESASGELLTLQKGVNDMVKALSNSRRDMEREVEFATVALRKTMQDLEQRNYELEVEQQRSESASLAKSQFLATMSHEIRTPLSGMIGMLQLLREGSSNRNQLDCIDSLDSAAQSLRQLIDDILDFSRLEVGKLAIQNKVFSPLSVIEEVMKMLAPSAQFKGLELVLDIESHLPLQVLGDPLRFRQVLINLTANAIKFTDVGSVVVRVRTSQAVAETVCSARFEIVDSGIGIPEDKQQLVFESFTQVDAGDDRSYGGSGLGATVSRELVEMMGGSIGLQSEVAKGSCFWFELPWDVIAAQERINSGNLGHALLLESHPDSRTAIQNMMQDSGLIVQVVKSVSELHEAIACNEYDWIFIAENSRESGNRRLLDELSSQVKQKTKLCQLGFVNGERPDAECVVHLNKPLLPTTLDRLLQGNMELPYQQEAGNPVRPLSVLLAEDESINARVISHFLEQGGHRVVRVGDGAEALKNLRLNGFDCVLMDLRMPTMDGLEATRLWRAEEKGVRLPIIALTANASEEDRQRCVDAGMDDYLTKPVDSTALLATIRRYCT